MFLQGIENIGASSWRCPPLTRQNDWQAMYKQNGSAQQSCHVNVTIIHAGRGTDLEATVPIVETDVAENLSNWVVVRLCTQHSQH